MKYVPILFNTEMVQAIIAGKKRQTRRIVKEFAGEDILSISAPDATTFGRYGKHGWSGKLPDRHDGNTYCIEAKPPCEFGDILWVRETWAWFSAMECASLCIGPCKHYKDEYGCFVYKADNPNFAWHPSIHMPRDAARIFLRVTDVRAELLATISDEDAIAEGANCKGGKNVGIEEKMRSSAVERFAHIWNSTIKRADYDKISFGASPWVWVITFERCDKPEGW